MLAYSASMLERASRARLRRFWVSESGSVARCEYVDAGGVLLQDVVSVNEPCWETDWRPSVERECPDDFAEELAELAYEAIDQGCSADPRFAGWDSDPDAAWAAVDAAWAAVNHEAA
jgi:hypothetical protein